MVSAPAAQGKSTLVADYLASVNARACWIHLRPEENDPERFYRRLRKACHPFRLPPSSPSTRKPQRTGATGDTLAERLRDLFGLFYFLLEFWD